MSEPLRPRRAHVYYVRDGVLRVVEGPLHSVRTIIEATPRDVLTARAPAMRYRVSIGDEQFDLDGRFEVFLSEREA